MIDFVSPFDHGDKLGGETLGAVDKLKSPLGGIAA
jgi:hypothetical protein